MRGETIISRILIGIALLGICISAYLTYTQIVPASSGCDFSDTVTCSLVNQSEFSEMFQVPVAVFGMLWFLILGLIAYHLPAKNNAYALGLVAWSALGILFVAYFISAEIRLRALCPYCTVAHVLIIITALLALRFLPAARAARQKEIQAIAFPWIVGTLILFIIPVIIFNVLEPKVDYGAAAQCLTDKGVVMYGSFRCGVCAKTRVMFEDAFSYIDEVECHPQGPDAQTARCLSKNIIRTPTWIIEQEGIEIKRQDGFMTVEELVDFAGCDPALIGQNAAQAPTPSTETP